MKTLRYFLLFFCLGLGSLTAGDLSRFAGDWAILYTNGAVRFYSISPRGEVLWVESDRLKKAKLKPSGRAYLLDFKDKKIERFIADGRGFRVEHYSPATNLSAGLPALPGFPERTQYFKVNKIKTW